MGCFSYLCKVCGKGIESNSFTGQECSLFLLIDGQIVERMNGQYDSYGRVFDSKGNSVKWQTDEWTNLVDLHYNKNAGDGFAAIHEKCLIDGMVPVTISESDPNQGWGDNGKWLGNADPDEDID